MPHANANQIDDDLVGHSDDGVTRHIRIRRVHQKIDSFGGSRTAVGNDGEASDEEISGAGVVQGAADPDEIVDLRLACVRAIVRVIHASASSKLPNR